MSVDVTTASVDDVVIDMVDAATKLPGVAEVIETYAKVAQLAAFRIETTTTVVRYATGGNC